MDRTGVVLNLVCPGLCKTDLSRNAPAQFREGLTERLEEMDGLLRTAVVRFFMGLWQEMRATGACFIPAKLESKSSIPP